MLVLILGMSEPWAALSIAKVRALNWSPADDEGAGDLGGDRCQAEALEGQLQSCCLQQPERCFCLRGKNQPCQPWSSTCTFLPVPHAIAGACLYLVV